MNALVPLPVLLPLCVTGLKLAIGPRLHRLQRFISIAVLGAVWCSPWCSWWPPTATARSAFTSATSRHRSASPSSRTGWRG